MKKILSKLTVFVLAAVMVAASGCDGKRHKGFSVSVKEVGPEYVEINVNGGDVIRMAYIVDDKEQLMNNPQQLFKKGTEVTVKGGEVIRISLGLKEKTQYYLYACAALNETEFSEIITLPFTTTEYNLSELVTVVDQYYDGYKLRLTIPKETKDRKNAIRYNQCCIMMYNYMKGSNDDYFSLLYNAGAYAVNDTTLVYSAENNWYQTDTDSDGDGEADWETWYNPISPGEPVVFVAGEFSWMEDTKEYENEFFAFPSGWDNGYYLPMINTDYYKNDKKSQSSMGVIDWDYTHPLDAYWTGAFQRKHFRIKEPDLLDAGVEIKLAKVTPVNATLEFYPEEGVDQYAFGIFDEGTYKDQVLPLLNGNPDFMQWAVTSYFSAYTFGTRVSSGAVQVDLTSMYYQSAIQPETKYIVFVTAMGNSGGTSQSFQTFEFETTKKVLDAPVIEVTAVESETTPFKATFNIKCATYKDNPLMEAYYAANYIRDWKLATNGGKTYFSILNGNNAFSAEELSAINSEKGYTISFSSVDGETTRLAVLGYNTEYTPNDVTSFSKEDIDEGKCPAIADVTTPWTTKKAPVDPIHYEHLVGDWTATATLQSGNNKNKTYKHESKITISADLYDYPAQLPEEAYKIYEEVAKKDREDVDAMYVEFGQIAESFTVNRLMNQNRLLCLGWLDDDSFGRLDAKSPYDLFVDKKYSSVDVSSIYNDFGPKWYIEAVADKNGNVSLIAPVDMNTLPPTANWSVPFYLSAMEPKNYYTMTYAQEGTLAFPVEYDSENDKLTIKPVVYQDVEYYPNVVGIDMQLGGTILENPVVSEVVLTRGWTEPEKEQSSLRPSSGNVQVNGEFPKTVYKERTRLKAPIELKKMEYRLVSSEEIKERADKYIKRYFNQSR